MRRSGRNPAILGVRKFRVFPVSPHVGRISGYRIVVGRMRMWPGINVSKILPAFRLRIWKSSWLGRLRGSWSSQRT